MRDYGSQDTVTIIKSNQTGLKFHAALIKGFSMMSSEDNHGSLDRAEGGGLEDFEPYETKPLRGVTHTRINGLLVNSYALHPAARSLGYRVFGRNEEGLLEQDVRGTLRYNQVDEKDYSKYEEHLEAEKELGDNPRILKRISNRIKGPLIWGMSK